MLHKYRSLLGTKLVMSLSTSPTLPYALMTFAPMCPHWTLGVHCGAFLEYMPFFLKFSLLKDRLHCFKSGYPGNVQRRVKETKKGKTRKEKGVGRASSVGSRFFFPGFGNDLSLPYTIRAKIFGN